MDEKEIELCLRALLSVNMTGVESEPDYLLRLKFDNLAMHFLLWIKAAVNVSNRKVVESASKTLATIRSILVDEEKFENEYGLQICYDSISALGFRVSKLRHVFDTACYAYISDLQPTRRGVNKLRSWRIVHATSYLSFLQILKGLIDDLDFATGSLWMLQTQKAHATEIMEAMSPMDLGDTAQSSLDTGTHDLIADAAASQLRRLRQRANATRPFVSGVLTAESSQNVTMLSSSEGHASSPQDSVPILTPESSVAGAETLQSRFAALVERSKGIHGDVLLQTYPVNRLAQRRILTELRRSDHAPPSTSLAAINSSISDLLGILVGPPDSPYQDGIFFIQFRIPPDYPFLPPKCRALTKIYHPNIDSRGEVCMDILKEEWQPVWSLWDLLLAIQALLQSPNEKDFSVEEVASLRKSDRRQFEANARSWTELYAKGDWPEPSKLGREWPPEIVAKKTRSY